MAEFTPLEFKASEIVFGQDQLLQKILKQLKRQDLLTSSIICRKWFFLSEDLICSRVSILLESEERLFSYLKYLENGGRFYRKIELGIEATSSMLWGEGVAKAGDLFPFVRKVTVPFNVSEDSRQMLSTLSHRFPSIEEIRVEMDTDPHTTFFQDSPLKCENTNLPASTHSLSVYYERQFSIPRDAYIKVFSLGANLITSGVFCPEKFVSTFMFILKGVEGRDDAEAMMQFTISGNDVGNVQEYFDKYAEYIVSFYVFDTDVNIRKELQQPLIQIKIPELPNLQSFGLHMADKHRIHLSFTTKTYPKLTRISLEFEDFKGFQGILEGTFLKDMENLGEIFPSNIEELYVDWDEKKMPDLQNAKDISKAFPELFPKLRKCFPNAGIIVYPDF